MTERLDALFRALSAFPCAGPGVHIGISDDVCDELLAAGGTKSQTIHTEIDPEPCVIEAVTLRHDGVTMTVNRVRRPITPADL